MAMMIFFHHYTKMLQNVICTDVIYLEKNVNLYWIYRYNSLPRFSSDLDRFFAYQWLNVPQVLWIFFFLVDKGRDFCAFAQYCCLSLLLLGILMWLEIALYCNYSCKFVIQRLSYEPKNLLCVSLSFWGACDEESCVF